jgi:hypothetical protein
VFYSWLDSRLRGNDMVIFISGIWIHLRGNDMVIFISGIWIHLRGDDGENYPQERTMSANDTNRRPARA